MKFIIKSGSAVKLYSGSMQIEDLIQFLKENFSGQNPNNLTHTDKDGDKICVTTQEDIEALKEINSNSQYIKLELIQNLTDKVSSPSKGISSIQVSQKSNISEKQTKIQEPQIKTISQARTNNKSCSKSPKKQIKQRGSKDKESRNRRHRKWQRRAQNSQQSDQKDSPYTKQRKSQIDTLINQKITKLVDERIKNLIPCIKNQIEHGFQNLIKSEDSNLIHEGVSCHGCSIVPISGIRYRCLDCPNFNLCQNCQQKIDHQHNLLKMKKLESNQVQSKKQYGFYKLGKQLFKEIRHNRHSSSQSGHRHRHGHRHGHGHGHRHGKNEWGTQQFRFNKKMNKLTAFFGERQNFKQFIQKHSDVRCRDLVDIYATENNIDAQVFQAKRDEIRKEKLAAFYDCPQSQFNEVIKENPKLNFRQIIQLLKQTGKRIHNGQNFKRMRQKLRQCRGRNWQEEKKEKYQSKNKSHRKESKPKAERSQSSKSKGEEMKEKGQILCEMKSLFGQDNGKQYFEFIGKHFQLGKQGIIEKWIQKVTK